MTDGNPSNAIMRCFEATEKEYQDAIKGRDQLRELCGELLDALKNHRELTRPIHQSDSAITKAERVLGEPNEQTTR